MNESEKANSMSEKADVMMAMFKEAEAAAKGKEEAFLDVTNRRREIQSLNDKLAHTKTLLESAVKRYEELNASEHRQGALLLKEAQDHAKKSKQEAEGALHGAKEENHRASVSRQQADDFLKKAEATQKAIDSKGVSLLAEAQSKKAGLEARIKELEKACLHLDARKSSLDKEIEQSVVLYEKRKRLLQGIESSTSAS